MKERKKFEKMNGKKQKEKKYKEEKEELFIQELSCML